MKWFLSYHNLSNLEQFNLLNIPDDNNNKISTNGYNYLLETLKFNKSIHTLLIQSQINELKLDKLSEMLLINDTIYNLSLCKKDIITIDDISFINFCNAIKKHNYFYSLELNINFYFISYIDTDYDIFINSLKEHKNLQELTLSYNLINTFKVKGLLDNLEYLNKLTLIGPFNYKFNNIIFKSLENKQYFKYLKCSCFNDTSNNLALSNFLNINKNITYLNLNLRNPYNFTKLDNNVKQSIINSKLQHFKFKTFI